MVTINKILNAMVLLLAIVACVVAILLHHRRVELRNRAEYLTETLHNAAIIVDGQGETATEIGAAEKINRAELGWEKYHHSLENGRYTAWEQNVSTIQDNLEQLSTMKINLADSIIALAEDLKYPQLNGMRRNLNSVNTFVAFADQIESHSNKVRYRDQRLAKALVQVSEVIKKIQEEQDFLVLSSENDSTSPELESHIEELISNVSQLHGRSDLLANGLANMSSAFVADVDGDTLFTPNWDQANFSSESVDDINQAFALLQKDLKFLNNQLYKLKVSEKLVDDQRNKLIRQTAVIEAINTENAELHNEVGAQKAQIARLNKKLQLVGNKEPEIAGEIKGRVTDINDRYNFIVIDKGRKHGMTIGAKILVHNQGEFICKAKVIRVLEDKTVCDILNQPLAVPTTGEVEMPEVGAEFVTSN